MRFPAARGLVIVGLAAPVLAAAGCGGSSGPGVAAVQTAGSPTTTRASSSADSPLAFAHCMRSHGVENFPDPDASGNFAPFAVDVPKTTANAANEACKHLLSGGRTATPEQLRQKRQLALQIARCVRRHGYPGFPDPTPTADGGMSQGTGPGVDRRSPRFQRVVAGCEQAVLRAVGTR